MMSNRDNRFSRPPIRLDRVRRIDRRGFAWVPNRFLHDGFFGSLSHAERSLYFFLVVAGDRNGVSFYAEQAEMLSLWSEQLSDVPHAHPNLATDVVWNKFDSLCVHITPLGTAATAHSARSTGV